MTTRVFRFQGRKANGQPCCATSDLSSMCDECRPRGATDGAVPRPPRLSDALDKTGGKHANHGQPNLHGVPKPLSLSKAIQAKGGRR
jgi:hypothetical protein